MKNRLMTSVIALSTACAAPALADVTVEDIWENQQAFYDAIGISLGGTIEGDQLVAPQVNVILPQNAGSVQITTDADVNFQENGDGTVTVTYPSPMAIKVAGSMKDEGSFTADFTMTHDGYSIIASGNPNDIFYASEGKSLRFEAGDIAVEGEEEFEVSGYFEISSFEGTSQVMVGNIITYVAETTLGKTMSDFQFADEEFSTSNQQTTLPMTSSVTASLPVDGSSVMNLSPATRNGLKFEATSTGEGSSSTSTTIDDEQMTSTQETMTGPQKATIVFGESGLAVTAEAAGFAMVMNDPSLLPDDLEFAADTLTVNYELPLNASDDPQDFRIATSLQGVTLGDSVWNLFDPEGQLPRVPAELSFDVSGSGTNDTDLLDFAALMQMSGPPAIEVDEVTIENLRIAAVGAELTAQGAMTFDWTDMQTIPGIARPEGQVTVNLNGANKLLDTLSQMGLISEEDMLMPRMTLGTFATPVGDDELESVLEINEQGHIIANGQRLQ